VKIFCHEELLGSVEEVRGLLCPKQNWMPGSSCRCHHEKLHMVLTLPMVREFAWAPSRSVQTESGFHPRSVPTEPV